MESDIPGKLIYYGRCELKQSDHRPVISLIDINAYCVDEDKRSNVFQNVIKDLGPPDGTVIIQIENCKDVENIFEDEFMNNLLQDFSKIGEVILIRFVNDAIWITFRDSQSALAAVQKDTIEIGGQRLKLTLKTPDWISCIVKEMGTSEIVEIAQPEFNLNSRVNHCSKAPPPRPIPPVRPRQPIDISSNYEISKSTQVENILLKATAYNDLSQGTRNYETPDNATTQDISTLDSKNIYPPPLPLRQHPLPPPKIPPPILRSSPPPVPARLCEGPPIPTRGNT